MSDPTLPPAAPPVTEDELHAYVDAQLDPVRLPALLAWLQTHPDDAARVADWQRQRLALRQAARALEFDPSLAEVPPALGDVISRHLRRGRRRSDWQPLAAGVMLLVTGMAAGVAAGRWWPSATGGAAPTLAASPAFVRDAVRAHAVFVPEKRHPVEVTASDEAHLVQWLSRRLGAPLKAPSLADQGWRLLGGRLLPGGEGAPRAQFMYEDASGGRLTLYVSVFDPGQAPAQTAFRSVREGQRESFYWVEDRYGYALSGDLPATELQALARSVYTQLSR